MDSLNIRTGTRRREDVDGLPTAPRSGVDTGPFRPFVAGASIALAAVSLLAGPAASQTLSNGPLTYEEGGPLQRLGYTPMVEGADVTARGRITADVWLGYANIFEQDSTAGHELYFDLERLVTSLGVRVGVSSRAEVGARLQLETTGGGVLDEVILRYHDALGFGQANRDRYPTGQYAQRLADGEGTVYVDIPRQRWGFEDARLFAKVSVLGEERSPNALSVLAEARIPGGSNPAASERSDVAVTAIGRRGFGPWYLHGMLGVSTLRASQELAPILRSGSTHAVLAVERSLGTISIVAQYQIQSAALDTFEHRELDRAPTNLVLGLSGRFGTSWRWDASFQEDLPADTPAIDFTVGLRVSRTW